MQLYVIVLFCLSIPVRFYRDKNTLQQANRKLERKMKEMSLQVNDEHLLLQNQRDQVRAVSYTMGLLL